jgi:hypothetical protein
MISALKCGHQHSYRLSAYDRRDNDFYPTPSDLVVSLPLGFAKLGLKLPRVALDPCGGDGALRRGLAPFGVDVSLSDLYPERHQDVDGYVTSQPLDASDPEHLQYSLELAGSGCTAIITNTPHNTDEACAIVRNLIALVEAQHVNFVAALFRSILGAEPGRLIYLNRPSFFGEILCCWRPRWIVGSGRPDARLRVVRLAEGATERPVVEGSRRQVRSDRGSVSREPANARLTAETKPLRSLRT